MFIIIKTKTLDFTRQYGDSRNLFPDKTTITTNFDIFHP